MMKLFILLISLLLLLENCSSLKVSLPISLVKCKVSKTKLNISPGAISVIKGTATLPVMYMLMSLNEYITHRYALFVVIATITITIIIVTIIIIRFYQHAEFNKIAKFFGLNMKIKVTILLLH